MDDHAIHATDALDDAAYLARSENRVRILDAVSTEPHTRRDLVAEADASSATVGRVLQGLQARGWAERTRDGYVATPAGEQVTAEFEPFIRAMATVRHLGDAVEWIPTDELSIDLHHFDDATVRRPARYDPAEVVDFFVELLQAADSAHVLTHLVPIEAKERALLDGLRTGRLDVEIVLTDGLLDYLRDHPDHRARWPAIIEAGASVNCHDDTIPCNLFVLDDVVILGNSHSDSGHPYACIVSENPTVRSWAHELIDRYSAAAERVDADWFAAEGREQSGRRTGEEVTVPRHDGTG